MDSRILLCAALAALACSSGSDAAAPPPPPAATEVLVEDHVALLDRFEIDAFVIPDGRTLVITQTFAGKESTGNPSGVTIVDATGGGEQLRALHNAKTFGDGDRFYSPGIAVRAGSRLMADGTAQVFGYLD